MKKIIISATITIILILALLAGGYFYFYNKMKAGEVNYQADAAKIRINDVHQIALLLESCKERQGFYPFVKELKKPPEDGYVTVPLAVMLSQPDQDWVHQPFPFSMSVGKHPPQALLFELKQCLGKSVVLPVDPQRRPFYAPNTYIVLFTEDDSFAVISFLYEGTQHTSMLAPHVYTYSVSSKLGSVMKEVLAGMKVTPREIKSISSEEIQKAKEVGEPMRKHFSQWATVSVD